MTDSAQFCLGGIGFFLLVVVPVVFYLKRRGETNKRLVLSIFAIWILWNLFHAPIHEISHFLGGHCVGLHLKDCQLIQRFWKGDFVHGYVTWKDGKPWQLLVMSQAPYVIDGVFILVGLFLFWRRIALTSVLGALILTLTLLRPVYDIATNYTADTILGGSGDFRFLFSGYPPLAVHIGAWLLMLLGTGGSVLTIVCVERTQRRAPCQISGV
ncbi:MAG: hypothetical protein ACLP7O_04425 [Terracidiphilus sp.]